MYNFDVHSQNTSLQEELEEDNELECSHDPMDDDPSLRADRWLTCRIDDATTPTQRVLFRTFVHASFREGRVPRDTVEDPWYLLVLWLIVGGGLPQITVCNHDGSLNLTTDCELCPTGV
jgi:hypothetical protein